MTVQSMVFGNAGLPPPGPEVRLTRDPATGARAFYYDFQFNGQGEDVVAGRQRLGDHARLRTALPAVFARLNEICRELEALFRDAQDFEFTIQSGALCPFADAAGKAHRLGGADHRGRPWSPKGLLTPHRGVAAAGGHRHQRRSRAPALQSRSRPPLARALAAGVGVAGGRRFRR